MERPRIAVTLEHDAVLQGVVYETAVVLDYHNGSEFAAMGWESAKATMTPSENGPAKSRIREGFVAR